MVQKIERKKAVIIYWLSTDYRENPIDSRLIIKINKVLPKLMDSIIL